MVARGEARAAGPLDNAIEEVGPEGLPPFQGSIFFAGDTRLQLHPWLTSVALRG